VLKIFIITFIFLSSLYADTVGLSKQQIKTNDFMKILPAINYLLLDNSANSNTVSFSCGWERGYLENGCWDESNEVDDNYSIQMVSSPVRKGNRSARFEVRPGDDPLGCEGCGERAEVADMTTLTGEEINETEESGTQYYAFSVMFEEDWLNPQPSDDGLWSHFFQLHGPDVLNASAAFAIDTVSSNDGTGISVNLNTGDLDDENNPFRYKSFDLSDNALNRGEWIDFIIKIKFASTHSGSVKVWRRNQGSHSFAMVLDTKDTYPNGVPTLQYRSSYQGGAVLDHYWKHGIYHPRQNMETGKTSILWLDGMSRTSSFNAAKHTSFP